VPILYILAPISPTGFVLGTMKKQCTSNEERI
jgi:hypothetical protein